MDNSTSGDWQPSANLEVLKLRARMLEQLRAFFSRRNVLEVETPILSSAGTPDPALASLSTRYTGPLFPHGQTLYLQTSPEFPMKRLLAAGSGSIYQVCKVFRDGECGRLHNPEFTMVEWYRVGFSLDQLMDEVESLVRELLTNSTSLSETEHLTYLDMFMHHTGLDPHTASAADFAHVARDQEIHIPPDLELHHDVAIWRDLLLTHLIEPHLGQGKLTFVYDYPASQAALARVRQGSPPLAERFELYLTGIELANGFHELADSAEQRTRFDRQHHARTTLSLVAVPRDNHLLKALENGLPDCSGVALGFDRLVMLTAGVKSIEEALAFPLNRA